MHLTLAGEVREPIRHLGGDQMESVGVVGAENGPHGRQGGNHGLNVGCLASIGRGTEGRSLAANHLNGE